MSTVTVGKENSTPIGSIPSWSAFSGRPSAQRLTLSPPEPRALEVPRVARRGGADRSSPVLTSEIELATFGCDLPSGFRQTRQ